MIDTDNCVCKRFILSTDHDKDQLILVYGTPPPFTTIPQLAFPTFTLQEVRHLSESSRLKLPLHNCSPPFRRIRIPPFSRSSSGRNKGSFQVPDDANSSTCSMMFWPLVESILSSRIFLNATCHIFSPLFSFLTPLSPRYITEGFFTALVAPITHGLTHCYISIIQSHTLSTRRYPQL